MQGFSLHPALLGDSPNTHYLIDLLTSATAQDSLVTDQEVLSLVVILLRNFFSLHQQVYHDILHRDH